MKNAARNQSIVEDFKSGLTLQEVGEAYGISRERVRQICKMMGVASNDGGQALKNAQNAEARRAAKDDRYMETWGCSWAFWKILRSMDEDYFKSPVGRYYSQKRNAMKRGIGWDLSLVDWWEIWQASGKYDQRGLYSGQYVMGRYGDSGPYAKDNVYITLSTDNLAAGRDCDYGSSPMDGWLHRAPLTPLQEIEQLEREDEK